MTKTTSTPFAMILCWVAVVMVSSPASTDAFTVLPRHTVCGNQRSKTSLNIEDWVAEMIDGEVYRQEHKKEFEEEWAKKNRATMMQVLKSGNEPSAFMPSEDPTDFRQYAKDKILASKDPERYCKDRCVATGNCDVFQEQFNLSADEVIHFCTNCVSSEDEEPCDVPEGFYDGFKP